MLACLSLKPSILCWKSVILFLWFLIPRTQAPGGLKSNLYSKPSSSAVHYYWGWIHTDFKTKFRRQLLCNTLEGLKNNYLYTQMVLQRFLSITRLSIKVSIISIKYPKYYVLAITATYWSNIWILILTWDFISAERNRKNRTHFKKKTNFRKEGKNLITHYHFWKQHRRGSEG